jgi:hypothetical protein
MVQRGAPAWPLELALVAGLALMAPQAFGGQPQTDNQGQSQSLRCRVAEGPWQACQMQVQDVGRRWSVDVGGQRLLFRHDGRGTVLMWHAPGRWVPVDTRWIAGNAGTDPALCWDGICAVGPIPLD